MSYKRFASNARHADLLLRQRMMRKPIGPIGDPKNNAHSYDAAVIACLHCTPDGPCEEHSIGPSGWQREREKLRAFGASAGSALKANVEARPTTMHEEGERIAARAFGRLAAQQQMDEGR